MSELLAPAGDYESLLAAISNGANAIYLGLDTFSARAYAKNFNDEELNKAIIYAHLRNVKIYVTMNTLVYESELDKAYLAIKKAYLANVDGLIIQDLALLTHTINYYPKMEAHASTQMGIDDINGIKLLEKIGVKRVVLSRECSIDDINSFKKQSKMPLEVFIHGALCVSYSGGCLMSGLIGMRSGNRGRCVGPCRKEYKLINATTDKTISSSYILSMKDLNTLDHITQLKNVDSLKIEGRMKSPEYVASIVRSYRNVLDGKKCERLELEKIFNRTFTKGYLFNEDKIDITNPKRPNNNGFLVGKITNIKGKLYEITLNSILNQGDQLRIDNRKEINIPATKIYDKNMNYINSATKVCYIELQDKALVGDLVYKTKDRVYMEEIQKTYPLEFSRLPLDFKISGMANSFLTIFVSYKNIFVSVSSEKILDQAINRPLSNEAIETQINKLNDTPYFLNSISFDVVNDFFITTKELNSLRREAIAKLDEKRLGQRKIDDISIVSPQISFAKKTPTLAVFVTTEEQYQQCLKENIQTIYYHNYARRNNVKYDDIDGDEILVGGYGGLKYFDGKNIVTDHSLNATNSSTLYNLYKLGAKRVTLSHEINKTQIKDLYDSYQSKYGIPNLEMIVYGHQELMYTKYCPLKKNNLCGECKKNKYYLDDGLYQFPIISYNDCTTSILNGKVLNLIDNINDLTPFINVFRLQFTVETAKEVKDVIDKFKRKLNNDSTSFFDSKTDTRGNYNREII